MKVEKATLVYVLGKLAVDQDIPIGLEKSVKHEDDPIITFDVNDISLEDLLNLLIEQERSYKWELADGVINFTPNENRSEFISSFLDLQFDQIVYPEGNENDTYSLKKSILELPEVLLLMNSMGVKDAGFLYATPSRQPVFSSVNRNLSYSNLTIKQFLNKIVSESDRNSWVVEMAGDSKNLLIISF